MVPRLLSILVLLLLLLLALLAPVALPRPTARAGSKNNETASMFIIPNTKWCGSGNVASSYENLGSDYETDKCCRDHDTCPNFILGLKTRYGLRNPFLTTLSECECDVRFYFCLQHAAKLSSTARFAINSFFRVLAMPCFELIQRPVCSERRFIFGSCLAERNETVAELRRLPFFTSHLEQALSTGRLKFRV